jgi:hypothetical protein
LHSAALAGFLPEQFSLSMENHQKTPALFKNSQRITITIPYETHKRIVLRAAEEGRSASNLCSFMLECFSAEKT